MTHIWVISPIGHVSNRIIRHRIYESEAVLIIFVIAFPQPFCRIHVSQWQLAYVHVHITNTCDIAYVHITWTYAISPMFTSHEHMRYRLCSHHTNICDSTYVHITCTHAISHMFTSHEHMRYRTYSHHTNTCDIAYVHITRTHAISPMFTSH